MQPINTSFRGDDKEKQPKLASARECSKNRQLLTPQLTRLNTDPLGNLTTHMNQLAIPPDSPSPKSSPKVTSRSSYSSRRGSLLAGLLSPRISLKEKRANAALQSEPPEKGYDEHIEKLLHILEGQGAEGNRLTGTLFKEFATLVEGIPKEKTNFVKPLESAACDLWRAASKLCIMTQSGISLHKIVDKHPHADLESVAEDIADLNNRFLHLLSCFLKNRDESVTLPKRVEWQNVDDVAKWVRNSLDLNSSSPLTRFIRSCSQDRYSGSIMRELLINTYGLLPIDPVPILAKAQSKNLTITRTFHEQGSNIESLEIPISILERKTEKPLGRIRWLLQFTYDTECHLTKIQTHAFLEK